MNDSILCFPGFSRCAVVFGCSGAGPLLSKIFASNALWTWCTKRDNYLCLYVGCLHLERSYYFDMWNDHPVVCWPRICLIVCVCAQFVTGKQISLPCMPFRQQSPKVICTLGVGNIPLQIYNCKLDQIGPLRCQLHNCSCARFLLRRSGLSRIQVSRSREDMAFPGPNQGSQFKKNMKTMAGDRCFRIREISAKWVSFGVSELFP